MATILSLFEDWRKNLEFQTYIQDIQEALEALPRPSPSSFPAPYYIPNQKNRYQNTRSYLAIEDLLQNPAPELQLPQDELEHLVITADQLATDAGTSKLKYLLTKLSRSATGHYQKMYVKDLQKSHNAFLANTTANAQLIPGSSPYATLKKHLEQCRQNVDSLYKKICSRLITSNVPLYESAHQASLLPRLSPSILLRLLARFNPVALSVEWKAALTCSALAITSMQRAERLVACGKKESEILNELTNQGHANWDPIEFPERLLLEIENNILIRPEQGKQCFLGLFL